MAQRVVLKLQDDIDQTEASQTVTFTLDGGHYEIDLNDEHAAELRAAIAPYITHGRRTGGRRARTPSARTVVPAAPTAPAAPAVPTPPPSTDPTAIRAWATQNGIAVSPKGRVPAAVRNAYLKAQ